MRLRKMVPYTGGLNLTGCLLTFQNANCRQNHMCLAPMIETFQEALGPTPNRKQIADKVNDILQTT